MNKNMSICEELFIMRNETNDENDKLMTPEIITSLADHDHPYDISSPTLRKKLKQSQEIIKNKENTIKYKQRQLQRIKSRVTSLTEAIMELRCQRMVSENCLSCLDSISDEGVKEFIERAIKNGKSLTRRQYPSALRSFALTLHFYSPRAYQYVREKMNMALPAPSVLRSWYNSIDGEAGFTSESFEALKYKVERARKENKEVVVSFMMDEMGIKKGTQRSKDGKVRGHVNFGVEFDINDNLREAKNALVFMVVALNDNWKLPIAYFLIDGIDSETSSGLVKTSLIRLHKIEVKVISLTLNGTNEHLSMIRKLGAKLDTKINFMEPYFLHPATQEYVYVIFDACHMLKGMLE